MNRTHKSLAADTPYQMFVLSLCLWALGTLAASAFLPLDQDTETILIYADTAVCGLFFLYRAPKRLRLGEEALTEAGGLKNPARDRTDRERFK